MAPKSNRRKPDPAFLYGPDQDEFHSSFGRQAQCWPVSIYSGSGITIYGPRFEVGAPLVKNGISFRCGPLYLDAASPRSRNFVTEMDTALADGRAIKRAVPGQSVLLATNGHVIYGHWLVDFLPKLFLLKLAGFELGKLKFLYPKSAFLFGFELLRLVGIRQEQLVAYDPGCEVLLAEELLIPALLRCDSDATPLFQDALAYVNEQVDREHSGLVPGAKQRIFISRTKSGRLGRPLLNTAEIEQICVSYGFTLVHPEQLPLIEQVAIFRGAREVIGQYGSALHGSIFAGKDLKMGCLQGTGAASAGFLQSAIGEARSQPTGYVLGKQALLQPVAGFKIAPMDLMACLESHYF